MKLDFQHNAEGIFFANDSQLYTPPHVILSSVQAGLHGWPDVFGEKDQTIADYQPLNIKIPAYII